MNIRQRFFTAIGTPGWRRGNDWFLGLCWSIQAAANFDAHMYFIGALCASAAVAYFLTGYIAGQLTFITSVRLKKLERYEAIVDQAIAESTIRSQIADRGAN